MADSNINKDVVAYFDRQSDRRMAVINASSFHRLGYYTKKADVAAIVNEHVIGRDTPAICDIGCNEGTFLQALIQSGCRATFSGVDVSPRSLEIARNNPVLREVALLKNDDEFIPLADQSQDIVTVIEVLEHVDDKQRLLTEICRILKPGGICILTTPNIACVSLRIQDAVVGILRAFAGRASRKDSFIDLHELVEQSEAAGLKMQSTQPMYWVRPYVTLSYYRATVGFLLPLFIPVPPSVLVWYQQWLNGKFGRFHLCNPLSRRLCWSIFAILKRP